MSLRDLFRWLFEAGASRRRSAGRHGPSGSDASSIPRSAKVLFYTRQGCHLCDEARALLERHGLEVTAVDIDADAALRARYGDCVPVVVIDGKERFRGRVNEVLLRRLLAGRAKSE